MLRRTTTIARNPISHYDYPEWDSCDPELCPLVVAFPARLYRRLCFDIVAGGKPSAAQSLWLRCKYSPLYNGLLIAIVWLHLIVSFLDAPTEVSNTTVAARALNVAIAVVLLTHSALSLYWRVTLDGRVSSRMLLMSAIAAVYLADAIVVIHTHYTTGTVQLPTRIPYSSVLRPVMVLLVMKSTQRTLVDVLVATYRSRQVLLLGGAVYGFSVVVVLSLVANDVTAEDEAVAATQGVGFGAFTSAMLTMFNLVFTGANFGTGRCPWLVAA